MHRYVFSLIVVAMLASCSGGSARPASIPAPDLDVRVMHDIFFGSSNTAPASIEVVVGNRGTIPITVRRIEIDTPGMVQYGFRRTSRIFNEVIAPGSSKPISMMVTAVTTTSRPNEPLTIRAIVEFEGGGTRWREILMGRQ